MPSLVHTILVQKHFVPLQFVHAIFCPPNFSPKILCPFNFCPPTFFSKHSWYYNILVHYTFFSVWYLIQLYFVLLLYIMELFFYRLYVSIHVILCPAGSYFRNSFTKLLNSHVLIYPISEVHIIISSAHIEHTFSLEITDVTTIMLVHQWPRPIFFDLICMDLHFW